MGARDLIVLDIDGVLLPWNFISVKDPYDPKGLRTGFDDWQRVDKKYFTHVSQDQLNLIEQAGDIIWLTTWLTEPGLIERFEETTGFGPHPRMPVYPKGLFQWWKAHCMVIFLEENADMLVEKYDRIVWVDDDIPIMRSREQSEVARVAPLPMKYVPANPVWRRFEIEELITGDDVQDDG